MPDNSWMDELDEDVRTAIKYKTERAKRIEEGIKRAPDPLSFVEESLAIAADETESVTWRLHATCMAAMGAARMDNWELVKWCKDQLVDGIEGEEAIGAFELRKKLTAKVEKLLYAYNVVSVAMTSKESKQDPTILPSNKNCMSISRL